MKINYNLFIYKLVIISIINMNDFKITIKDNSITVQIGMFIMNKLLSADCNKNVLIDNNCVECDCDDYGKKKNDLTDCII